MKVGLDCIPPVRRAVLEALLERSEPLKTGAITGLTKYPKPPTVRRALEDLYCHGIVEYVRSPRTGTRMAGSAALEERN